jgi:hypothetical protein
LAAHLSDFVVARMLPEMRPKVAMQSLMGGVTVAATFEGQDELEAVVAGIPTMADIIAAMPDGQRAIALDALEHHYLQTAQNLGCTEGPARTWTSAVMLLLRERMEQMTEPGITQFDGEQPDQDYSLAEKILTRATGALALLAVCPLVAFIWVGLKLERPGPAIDLRMARLGEFKAYRFVLGSGWVSRAVRRANLQAIPTLWHLVNGDNVLGLREFAEIVRPGRSYI